MTVADVLRARHYAAGAVHALSVADATADRDGPRARIAIEEAMAGLDLARAALLSAAPSNAARKAD